MIAEADQTENLPMPQEYLVRLGLYGEHLRCLGKAESEFSRGTQVVVSLERGEMLAEVLQKFPSLSSAATAEQIGDVWIARAALSEDLQQQQRLLDRTFQDFQEWQERLEQWKVNVELVDLEWTLDGNRLMLYVLNDRGPETTKLALQAAAAGFSHVDVLPVTEEGLSPSAQSSSGKSSAEKSSSGGGCGCGSGGGGCHK